MPIYGTDKTDETHICGGTTIITFTNAGVLSVLSVRHIGIFGIFVLREQAASHHRHLCSSGPKRLLFPLVRVARPQNAAKQMDGTALLISRIDAAREADINGGEQTELGQWTNVFRTLTDLNTYAVHNPVPMMEAMVGATTSCAMS